MEEPNPSKISPLPDDLTSEILLRLPADSIARFRCAAKIWLSLTTDSYFTKTHSAISPISISSFYWYNHRHQTQLFHLNRINQSSSSSDPSLSFLDFKDLPAKLADSCNGLILCHLPKKAVYKEQPFLLSVCNPATREHDVIPFSYDPKVFIFRLAFDPSISPHFKIVAFRYSFTERMYFMHIFSSENRLWKRLNNNIWDYVLHLRYDRSVFWKGSLCWLAFGCVLCLDIETEKFHQLPLPPSIARTSCIGESGGRLHCVMECNYRGLNFKNSRYDIFEMESRSSNWSLLHRVDVDDAMVHLCPEARVNRYLPLNVLWFVRGGEDGFGDRLLLRLPSKIVAYHLKDMTFSTICSELDRGDCYWYNIYPHGNTLFPMNAPRASQDWICWKNKHDKLLIALMVEQSLNGKKNKRGGFKKNAWLDILEKFNSATKLNFEVSHLQNRFKSYKREYKTVSNNLSSGVSCWNPSRETVMYKRKQVRFKDLEIIFA